MKSEIEATVTMSPGSFSHLGDRDPYSQPERNLTTMTTTAPRYKHHQRHCTTVTTTMIIDHRHHNHCVQGCHSELNSIRDELRKRNFCFVFT